MNSQLQCFDTSTLMNARCVSKAAPEPDVQAQEGDLTREAGSASGSQQLLINAGEELIAEESSSSGFDEEDDDDGLHSDFVPYDSASLEERHMDDQLQTTAQAEALDKSLRRSMRSFDSIRRSRKPELETSVFTTCVTRLPPGWQTVVLTRSR